MTILEDYKKSLKLIEVEEILDLIFYRPLAFILVRLIFNTNITPNQLTITALCFGIFGSLMYLVNTHNALILAGIFFITYDVLDCADGQLARLKHNGTPIGRVLDGLADYIVSIAFYLCIGFGLSGNYDNPILFWLLVVGAGLSNALHSSVLDFYRNRFLDYALARGSILGDSLKEFKDEYDKIHQEKGKYFQKLLLWIYLKYSYVQLKSSSSDLEVERKKYNVEDFLKKHKTIMHLWTYLGPTTELTFLIIASFINRIDFYLWGLLIVGNLYTIILYIFQYRINKSTKLTGTV
jgi:hypothetical protein